MMVWMTVLESRASSKEPPGGLGEADRRRGDGPRPDPTGPDKAIRRLRIFPEDTWEGIISRKHHDVCTMCGDVPRTQEEPDK